jgi:uncharacterized membrane protein
MMTIEQALAYWVRNKHLTKKKALELVDSLPPGLIDHEKQEDMSHRAISIFSAAGAILLGLGVILFVASNWSEMSSIVKTAILLLGMITTGVAGYYFAFERKSLEKTGLGLLFVNILIFGASIFLVAQIYHLQLNFWLGALLWFLGCALFAGILQSRLHFWTSVPLLLLFLGWLRSSFVGGAGEFDFLGDPEYSLLTLLPIIGAALVASAVLARKNVYLRFGSSTLFDWGVFLICLIVVLSTVDRRMFYSFLQFPSDPMGMVVAVIAAALVAAAFVFGSFETKQGKWGLLALALYVAFLYILAYAPTLRGIPVTELYYGYYGDTSPILMVSLLFALHVILAFIFFLVIVWYGTLLRLPPLINIGMLALAVAIIVQYFSWALRTLDRSVAFILGGIVILVLSAVLERQRRTVLSSIKQP